MNCIELFRKIFRNRSLDADFIIEFRRLLSLYGNSFHLSETRELTEFLAQVKNELGVKYRGKVVLRENLNYSKKRLKLFSSYFRNHPDELERVFKLPKYKRVKEIANIWYADKNRPKRLRLGNTDDGDGWLYRGAGILQVTGKEQTVKLLKYLEEKLGIRLLDDNNRAYEKELDSNTIGILLGFAYWDYHKLYEAGSTEFITRLINPGLPKAEVAKRVSDAVRIGNLLDKDTKCLN